jgi:hypothetical protein
MRRIEARRARRDQRFDQSPFVVGQIARILQLAAVVTGAVFSRPHGDPFSNQATTLESQMIHLIQEFFGQTLMQRNRPIITRTWRQVLYKRQDDFARKPFVAPIKAHLTPELACNYVFHDARAEPAARGRRDGRPARFNPAQTEPSVCCLGPSDFNATIRCR